LDEERIMLRSVEFDSLTEGTMKKLILVGALALMSSGAFAQTSQGQGGAQAGTNGSAANAPGSAMQSSGETRTGTTGSNTGMQSTGPNGSAGDRPTAKSGPVGADPSASPTTPK
jgi:hypothetical protein